MLRPSVFKVVAIVAVVAVAGLLVYRVDAHREFIPSEKQEQYLPELADGVRLVQRQTSDIEEGFSETFATLRPQGRHIGGASGGQSGAGSKISTLGQSEYVRSIEELRGAWTPKYLKVSRDHGKFLSRVENARQRAVLYFGNQSRLTSTIKDEKRRLSAENRDSKEYAAFQAWEAHVDELAASAAAMMDDFHDMDTIIQKQIMSAQFAELSEQFFVEVPESLMRLNEDLEEFSQQSESLYEVFGDSVTNMFRQGEQ